MRNPGVEEWHNLLHKEQTILPDVLNHEEYRSPLANAEKRHQECTDQIPGHEARLSSAH